jgi:hypothetical protein
MPIEWNCTKPNRVCPTSKILLEYFPLTLVSYTFKMAYLVERVGPDTYRLHLIVLYEGCRPWVSRASVLTNYTMDRVSGTI